MSTRWRRTDGLSVDPPDAITSVKMLTQEENGIFALPPIFEKKDGKSVLSDLGPSQQEQFLTFSFAAL